MIVELMTGCLFVAVFLLYFVYGQSRFELNGKFGLDAFHNGGWIFYLIHMSLLCALLAASAIDLELWVIPLSLCWFITVIGLAGSALGRFILGVGGPDSRIIGFYKLFPNIDYPMIASLTIGAAIGLIIALVLLMTGVIKRSYPDQDETLGEEPDQDNYNHRFEVLKEVVFLLPIIICSVCGFWLYKTSPEIAGRMGLITQNPFVFGFIASLWGYFIGCAIVWATRILGTLAFGKEAMGLGDVHLMGAAGTVIGPVFIVIAFFIAPFFGLTWAFYQMFFKKTRQIPYGPFLSLAIFAVMIFHNFFRLYIYNLYMYK
jgi:leader peptidase (prepilin peptidase)/N-methyltransferase